MPKKTGTTAARRTPTRASSRTRRPTPEPKPGQVDVDHATGKSLDEWYALLDESKCTVMTHRQIVMLIQDGRPLSDEVAETITVGYELARGMREPDDEEVGHAARVSCVIDAPVSKIYRAWADTRTRKRWLETNITIRVATPPKAMRLSLPDRTALEVTFTSKGDARSEVEVQHRRLPNAKDVAKVKKLWAERLELLRALLQGATA